MAHIAKRETLMRRNGRPVVRWVVRWDDPVRDSNGVPVREESDGRGKGRIKVRRRERAFEAERDALDFLALVSKDHRDGKRPDYRAGDEPFGTFAASWLDSMRAEVKARTVESYESQLRTWILPRFGHRAVGSITPADARAFRDELRAAGLSASSMRSAIAPLRRILDLAVEDGAISTNPAASVKLPTAKKMARDFEARPVSSADVATVAGVMAAPWDLLTLFAAYTGLRAGEQAALDVCDLPLRRTASGHVGGVSVSKTTRKVRGGWVATEPKSKRSRRTVPLPGWLAEEMAAYLAAHPRRDEPTAPLWPGRARGGTSHGATTYDTRWEPGSFGKTIFRPALLAAGLIAAETDDEGSPGVRWHDLRHHFASASLMAGVPVMQVSEWLGHASYTVTLDVYAHWIPKEEDGFIDRLARPTAAPRQVAAPVASVTPIDARRTS